MQGKKKRDAQKADAERAEANAQPGVEVSKDDGIGGGEAGGADMLHHDKDEDVIF